MTAIQIISSAVRRTALCAGVGAVLLTGAFGAAAQAPTAEDDLADRIRARIEGARSAAFIVVGEERLHAATELPRYYNGRDYRPAWVGPMGPRAVADSALWAIEGAILEGLESRDYHLVRIRDLYAELARDRRAGLNPDPSRLADLDLLLTDALLVYMSHLIGGRVDPTTIHPEWNARPGSVNLVGELDMALATGKVGERLEKLLPQHPGYERLRKSLADYRRIAGSGGWPMLPGRTLSPGQRDPAVALLRERLRMTGDLTASARRGGEELYDEAVEAAVRRAQARHNLQPTGVVDLGTSGELNIPVEDRIRQIELNMERWRWLPRELGDRHIIVNIAGLDMHIMEGDSSVFHSRVLVGQRYRKTPVFSDRMTYLVLNPTWTIPPGILEEDKLPLIRRDVSYLARNNIRILDAQGRVVDPSTIDFNGLTGRTGLRFRMYPGPENPMGQVKFMFPNEHHIYLHDTPDRQDFNRTGGAVSSGCIRVEESLALTEYLLADSPGWDRERIEREIRTATGERTVTLRQPLPIHILYWTTWVDPDGGVQFRRDIYDRDGPLDQALSTPPPSAIATSARD